MTREDYLDMVSKFFISQPVTTLGSQDSGIVSDFFSGELFKHKNHSLS